MRLLVFETTHHALWAEQVARDRGLAAEVVPAPASAAAKCGLALEFLPDEELALTGALAGEGVQFRVVDV